jgi:alcohol dehydrogenase
MDSFRFQNPTVLYYGKGQLEKYLATEVTSVGKRVLLVYGGGSIKKNGLYDKVVTILQDAGVTIFELPGVEPNPRLSTVRRGIDMCRTENVDLVLAVGGGSVIDCAKAIAMGTKFDGDVWDVYERKVKATGALPIGAILTLAATGSEMNRDSVISNWETKEKLSCAFPFLFPKFSFCDPENTFSVPKNQTIYGISDILAHCFEHYFHATTNTPLQQHLIEGVMRTVVETAKTCIDEPTNYDARETIMFCSTMALNEIVNMGLIGDWACHKIEHELSAIYDIPHGGGLAIIFPHWMDHVWRTNPARFASLAVHVFDVPANGLDTGALARKGIEKVREFFVSIGAPTRLSEYDIDSSQFVEMANQTVRFGPVGAFRKLQSEDVLEILRKSL